MHSIEEREDIRNAAKGIKDGMKGVEEGQDRHMLEVTDILKDSWGDVTVRTIARCCGKANILTPSLKSDMVIEHGKNTVHGRREWYEHLYKLCMVLSELKLSAPHQSDIKQKLNSIDLKDMELVANWVAVEEDS